MLNKGSHHILLIEDNAGDIRLIEVMLKEIVAPVAPIELHCALDGVEATDFLQKKGKFSEAVRPNLIILDLNLPKKDGRQVLSEIKMDAQLKSIPVIVLTISQAEEDIVQAYHLGANCYVRKPLDIEQFSEIFKSIINYWFYTVTLPPT